MQLHSPVAPPPRAALNDVIEMRTALRRYNEEHAPAHPLDVHSGVETGLGIAGGY